MRKIMLLVAAFAMATAACGDDAGPDGTGEAPESPETVESSPPSGAPDDAGDAATGDGDAAEDESRTTSPAAEPGDSGAPDESAPITTLPGSTGSGGSERNDSEEGAIVPEESPTTDPPTTPAGTPPTPGIIESGLERLVEVAIADLSSRLGVAGSEIVAVSAESVVWPDGSLGCSQPDMAYTQVQVDGALITLGHGESTYGYHSGGARDPFLCVPSKTDESQGTVGTGSEDI
ncbi:MAG: hypothetical protein ACE5GC_06065 [Acidimicrobiia bacterium]